MNDSTRYDAEPVAIIGEACRVPGAGSVAQFWQNLLDGVESVRIGTLAEHAAAGVPPHELDDPDFVPVSSVLSEAEGLDPGALGMSAAEAELRDPQHRLFLELSYTALDDSGYDPSRYSGDIGVYAASGEDAYQWRNVRRNRKAMARAGIVGLAVNSHPDYAATFTSYRLGLRGPSLTVHTACSSSMVAAHLASEALRNGECDMALAGGANLDLPLGCGYVYAEGGVNSRDGHCRAFDAGATGTVWGSGGAVLVLKRLTDAVADHDCIRAVIIGNAVNNDGATKVGFTAPSEQGQAAAIAQALSYADVDPRSIGFVEAHGTATVLGDPIEVAALTSAYQRRYDERGWCAIGSVKSNIGHLGPAAGAAGLLKAALAIEHGIIPASLNYESANPAIDFAASPFFVNTEACRWRNEAGEPRRAAVSSFGMGGTNAHLILEQAPEREVASAGHGGPHVIRLSASTPTALAASATALADHLDARPETGTALADVAFTLEAGRRQSPERLAVVAPDARAAADALRDSRRWITGSMSRRAPRIVFLFPGQGAQYEGMGAGLYEHEPVYREAVDQCCDILDAVGTADGYGTSLRASLSEVSASDAAAVIRTEWAQPALFTVEYALAALLGSWGVTPQAMIGHSIGEYVAATCAGVFELADALRIVAARGQLMQSLPGGAMIAVPMAEPELRELLPDGASIAAVNGPGACVVSGPDAVIDQLETSLAQAEVRGRRLRTSHAFHSPMMDPLLARFRQVVATAELKAPRIPFASNITGDWITEAEATDPSYWARHLRETVRFGDCVTTAAGHDAGVLLLECGPGRQLSGLARMRRAAGPQAIQCMPGLGAAGQELVTLATAGARLWAAGQLPVPAPAGASGRRVPLPTYPWERRMCWVHPDPDFPDGTGQDLTTAQAAPGLPGEFFAVPTWRQLPPHSTADPPSQVLVLADAGDLVGSGLAVRGTDVVRVSRGSGYASDGPGSYLVRPDSREDYEALFADLAAQDGIPRHIVHCWTLADPPAADAGAVWTAQSTGFFSVLALAQALVGTVPEHRVHVDVVTAGTQATIGGDLRRQEHATVAGTVKVLPLEFPWLTTRHVDVDPDFAARAAADGSGRLAAALIDELCGQEGRSGSASEALVALRNGRRWRRHYEDVAGAPDGTGADRLPFQERGTYLITGGLGGIGITLAEDLALRLRARLVLVSRESLPPREAWSDEAAGHLSARAARAIAAIQRMERAGAEVLAVAADVADPGAVRAVREEVLRRFGCLDGIIHAAGVAGGGMAEVKDRATAEGVLRPKLSGTLALRDAFGDDPLHFVVLCSSVTAVAGRFGQVDYCAANAFLDAHANSGHGWRAPVISVNWDAWLQVGMAAEVAAPAAFRALQRGPGVLPIRHGLLTERHLPEQDSPVWCAGTLSASTHWILADHRIGGVPVLPGTGLLEAARCAVAEGFPAPGPDYVLELRDIALTQLCAVPDAASAELRVILVPRPDGAEFEVVSVVDGLTRVHARGEAAWIADPAEQPVADLALLAKRCSIRTRDLAETSPSRSGLVVFGPHWGGPVQVLEGDGEVLTLLAAQDGTAADAQWMIHPVLLDEALSSGRPRSQRRFLPFGYGRVVVRQQLPARVWGHLRYQDAGTAELVTADLTMYDESGAELLRVEDFSMRRVDESAAAELVTAGPAQQAQDQASPAAGIKPSRGATALRRVAGGEMGAQVVVTTSPVGELITASQRVDYEAVEQGPVMAGEGAPEARVGGEQAGPPRTEREREVEQVWAELLGTGADQDFFEAGGNSLIAVQLISFLRKRFGIRLPMRRFFADPTIAGVAALIDELSPATGQADAWRLPAR